MIPPKTAEKLQAPPINGQRHKEAVELSLSLLGEGLSPNAVYQQLRDRFPFDVTDRELENVVRWAEDRHPTPSAANRPFSIRGEIKPRKEPPKPSPATHCQWWLSGLELDATALANSSPVQIPENQTEALKLFLESLYLPSQCLNIVTLFSLDEKKRKANPSGTGKSQTRTAWIEWLAAKGIPQSQAGAWLRMNPVDGLGVADDNVTAFRYLLVESDVLPLPVQIALYSRLPLPVVAIFSSGGKSAHAWVRLDSPDLDTYKATASRILAALSVFGVDESNKNASRLSRLPGAQRKIGAHGDGLQRLLWLNPSAVPIEESELDEFESALRLPALEEKPMKALYKSSMERYEELRASQGHTGIFTGLTSFDRDTGGLKRGQVTVISAQTNGGKTSIAINFINAALHEGHGVALFTLEMDRDEIIDILMAINCQVNRNNFNTGKFSDQEISSMTSKCKWFGELRLWIEDAPTLTAAAIRNRTLQLVREKQIGLAVVDYIQFVFPENSNEPREQQIAAVSRALRALAKEARIPILVLSQLNDDGKLRESRVIGHDAHNVVQIENIDKSPVFRVVKGRSIPKGPHEFVFKPEFCLVENPKKITEADHPKPYSDS